MDTSNLEEEMKQLSDLDEEIDEDVFEPVKPKSAITLSKVRCFAFRTFSKRCDKELIIMKK